MLFNETFFKNCQVPNTLMHIRQAGTVNQDKKYTITRSSSHTNVIGYIYSGKLHIKIDNNNYLISDHTAFLLLNNSDYTICSDIDDPPIMYWCNIRGILFDQVVALMTFGNFSISDIDLVPFFQKIKTLLESEKDQTYNILKAIFSVLCDIKSNWVDKNINLSTENSLPRQIEIYISNHIQSHYSLKKMAEELNISEDTATRSFKSEYSMTPYQFYQNVRIDIAKSLLANSDISIEDIAQRLNYTDRNYFSLVFKKSTGTSPAKYRRLHRT